MRTGEPIPNTTFFFRKENPNFTGIDKNDWFPEKSQDLLVGKKVIIVGVPGPFTPVCSGFQVPQFEKYYNDFKFEYGIEEIYITAVADFFVMDAWKKSLNLKNLKMLPDGSGDWARLNGMLVNRAEWGYGYRSWRYAMIVDNLIIERMFCEPNPEDMIGNDPYGESAPQNILEWLSRKKKGEDLKEEWLYPRNLREERILGEKGVGEYKEFNAEEAFRSSIDK